MTEGEIMFYGGSLDIVTGILVLLIGFSIFPKQRKKLLKKLSEDYGDSADFN